MYWISSLPPHRCSNPRKCIWLAGKGTAASGQVTGFDPVGYTEAIIVLVARRRAEDGYMH